MVKCLVLLYTQLLSSFNRVRRFCLCSIHLPGMFEVCDGEDLPKGFIGNKTERSRQLHVQS